jgi:hypothetical protein
MLATFCARVALGLVASLLLFSPRQLHPRFFRTHFLTALGLLAVATTAAWSDVGPWLGGLLAAATVLCLLGSLSWTLDPAPAGRMLIVVTTITLIAILAFLEPSQSPSASEALGPRWRSGSDITLVIAGITSSCLLGMSLTAMLVGHSYLISPGMALTPLIRSVQAGGVALLVRVAVIAWGLWCWTERTPTYTLNDEVVLLLPVRWLVGVVAPLVFGGMAYSAARIRSTQSATGILYVVVVCGFLGELLSLVLTRQTGLPL